MSHQASSERASARIVADYMNEEEFKGSHVEVHKCGKGSSFGNERLCQKGSLFRGMLSKWVTLLSCF